MSRNLGLALTILWAGCSFNVPGLSPGGAPGSPTDPGMSPRAPEPGITPEPSPNPPVPTPPTSSPFDWTTITSASDTQFVYVSSSSGSDQNDGRSEATPKATLLEAVKLLRAGFPDHLYVRRGDVFGAGFTFALSGRNHEQPIVISTYGSETARPRIETGTADGITVTSAVEHVVIEGLHFVAQQYQGYNAAPAPLGLNFAVGGADILIENSVFQRYDMGIALGSFSSNTSRDDIRLRAVLLLDNYRHGLYATRTDGLLVEYCVFDHNGWSETSPGQLPSNEKHGASLSASNANVVIRASLFSRNAADGLQLRSSGTLRDNLFVHEVTGFALGADSFGNANGIEVTAERNVVLDGRSESNVSARGVGFYASNITSGVIADNIIAHLGSASDPHPMILDANGSATNNVGVHALAVRGNVFYDWDGTSQLRGYGNRLSEVTLEKNEWQRGDGYSALLSIDMGILSGVGSIENHFFRAQGDARWFVLDQPCDLPAWKTRIGDTSSIGEELMYADPMRDLMTYQVARGQTATLSAFLDTVRTRSRASWDFADTAPVINEYIRAGFVR